MWVIGLEDKSLVSIVKHTKNSAILSSRRCPIVFLYIGMKFTSDREDFIVETLSSYSNILYRREQKKIMLDKYLGLCCQGQTQL